MHATGTHHLPYSTPTTAASNSHPYPAMGAAESRVVPQPLKATTKASPKEAQQATPGYETDQLRVAMNPRPHTLAMGRPFQNGG